MTVMPAVLDPEMVAAKQKSEEILPGGLGDIPTQPIAVTRERYRSERAWWNAEAPDLPLVEDVGLAGPNGPFKVRVYRPVADGVLPVVVWFHGGGFVYGDLDTHDRWCRMLAQDAGCAVVAVDYHLAPEAKFPAPLVDGIATLEWLSANAGPYQLDAGRIAMGGDSAGASISLGIALWKKADLAGRLKALTLIYGNYGIDPQTTSIKLYGGPDHGLSGPVRAYFRESYLATPGDAQDLRVNQLAADLSGLPPVFLGYAECDPLADASPALAARLEAHGVQNSLHRYDGVLHGFIQMSRMVSKANVCRADTAAFLKAAFG